MQLPPSLPFLPTATLRFYGIRWVLPFAKVSNGGAAFFAGKSINNKDPKEQASISGAVAMALHVRQMAKFYGIPVVIHSDHCAKKLLPWFDGMLEADEVGAFARCRSLCCLWLFVLLAGTRAVLCDSYGAFIVYYNVCGGCLVQLGLTLSICGASIFTSSPPFFLFWFCSLKCKHQARRYLVTGTNRNRGGYFVLTPETMALRSPAVNQPQGRTFVTLVARLSWGVRVNRANMIVVL